MDTAKRALRAALWKVKHECEFRGKDALDFLRRGWGPEFRPEILVHGDLPLEFASEIWKEGHRVRSRHEMAGPNPGGRPWNSGRIGDLDIAWKMPEGFNPGILYVWPDDGGNLEAFWGPAQVVVDSILEGRDQATVDCILRRGGTMGWVEDMRLPPERRGRGTGGRMLDAALERFRRFGVDYVMAWPAPLAEELRPRLLAFYRHRGFELAPECAEPGHQAILLDLRSPG
jgi:GNAT superfamily N-acetyltransferase